MRFSPFSLIWFPVSPNMGRVIVQEVSRRPPRFNPRSAKVGFVIRFPLFFFSQNVPILPNVSHDRSQEMRFQTFSSTPIALDNLNLFPSRVETKSHTHTQQGVNSYLFSVGILASEKDNRDFFVSAFDRIDRSNVPVQFQEQIRYDFVFTTETWMLCEYITLMFCASQSWWNSLRGRPKHAKIACVRVIRGQDDIPGIAVLLHAGLSTWHHVTTPKLLLNVRVLYPYTIFSSHLQKIHQRLEPSWQGTHIPIFSL
jgi:hypothetical protein